MRALERVVGIRWFVLASAAIFLVVLALSGARQGRAAGWVLCLEPILLLFWILGSRRYRSELIARFETAEVRAAPTETAIPDRLAIVREELGSLGFRKIAQIESRFPWQSWRSGWAWRDRAGTTTAVISGAPGVRLSTVWPDGAVVTSTNLPPRASVSLPNVRQVGIRGEAAQLYLQHRDVVAAFASGHGEPLQVETAEAFRQADKLARPALRDAYAEWTGRLSARITEVTVSAFAVGLLILQVAASLAG